VSAPVRRPTAKQLAKATEIVVRLGVKAQRVAKAKVPTEPSDVSARFKRDWDSMSRDWRDGYLAALDAANKPSWRCFHCDAFFTDPDEARVHFGQRETAGAPECVRQMIGLLRSDVFAMTFQTLGQYRTALLEAVAGKLPEIGGPSR
jgi:hypothetical protein